MRPLRFPGLGAVTLLAWGLVASAGQGPKPLEPARDSGASVSPAFEGWYKNADGSVSILVGYFNRNLVQTLDIPVGPDNHIDPGGPDHGQPTHFLARRQWGVFTITLPKGSPSEKLTWTITANGQTTSIPLYTFTAPNGLDPLYIVEPLRETGVGNAAPVVRFTPGGTAYTGPPQGIAISKNVRAGEPLPLNLWVTDDGIRPPEAAPAQGPPATVFWSKFRGPGAVTFENPRPALETDDGKSSTTARFSAPGEYILRAQVNDASGDGGGGFQCCWTNVHVKVSVH